jgi:DNA topoisomerase-1
MVPTEICKTVNKFMNENFVEIMDIEFTAKLESYLDMIAEGKANWITILKNFYDAFNPIVEKLLTNAKQSNKDNKDKLLGVDNGLEIYSGVGKYGPYVKIQDKPDSTKWRYASAPSLDITFEDAKKLLDFPIELGKIGAKKVSLNKGPYGLYIKVGTTNLAIKDKTIDVSDINLDYVKNLLENEPSNNNNEVRNNKVFKLKDKTIYIHSEGQYGPYIQITSSSKTGKNQNIPIPRKYNPINMTLDDVLQIIASKNGTINNKY